MNTALKHINDPYKTRVDVELSIGWAMGNFNLFIDSLIDFNIDYPETEWARKMDTSRAGFITMTANRKVSA